MKFLSDDGGAEYNLCMCMSFFLPSPAAGDESGWMLIMAIVYNNFEISDLDFWRGKAYTAYFDHLDRSGGFYYEVRSHLTVTYGAFQLR
jgi:Glycolipid 2-alpha-mannosyltransferase